MTGDCFFMARDSFQNLLTQLLTVGLLTPALNETPTITCCHYAKRSSKQHNGAPTI